MLSWFAHLDRLLRGDTTRPELLREGRIEIDARGLAMIVILLGAIYGACMGSSHCFEKRRRVWRTPARHTCNSWPRW